MPFCMRLEQGGRFACLYACQEERRRLHTTCMLAAQPTPATLPPRLPPCSARAQRRSACLPDSLRCVLEHQLDGTSAQRLRCRALLRCARRQRRQRVAFCRVATAFQPALPPSSPVTPVPHQDVVDGWTRVYHPISAFECKDMGDYGATPSQLNRLQW